MKYMHISKTNRAIFNLCLLLNIFLFLPQSIFAQEKVKTDLSKETKDTSKEEKIKSFHEIITDEAKTMSWILNS
jgi:hypothetical protein